ncbi:MAG: hypothetical protein XXXJIFNMEKO3_00672 [Candidatus Erwinia impunctatus]|nr:hypothetical protein XXXJIFNMEKO_00672 [Culicoides impunctatus]
MPPILADIVILRVIKNRKDAKLTVKLISCFGFSEAKSDREAE